MAMYHCEYCILREEIVRERRENYNGFVVGYIPSLLDNIKKGPGNFSSGRSPHWVNHINLCLSCIVCLLCFVLHLSIFKRFWIHLDQLRPPDKLSGPSFLLSNK